MANSSSVIDQIEPYQLEEPMPLFQELPIAPTFPVENLGEQLSSAVMAIQDQVQCPLALSAQSILGAVSVAVQNHIDVVLPTGAVKPVSLYLLTVGASGERKTSSDRLAMQPIRDYEKHLRKQYRKDFTKWKNEHDIWAKERKKIIQGDSSLEAFDEIGESPPAPVEPLLTCEEPTYAALCRTYESGYPGIGIFSDEGGEFLGGHSMNEHNRLRMITGLSKLWDGGEIKRVRAGDGNTTLSGKRLSLHLLVQPMMAFNFLSDPVMNNQGFLSRFLFTFPESTMGTRLWKPKSKSSQSALADFSSQLTHILHLPMPISEDGDRSLTPRRVGLSLETEAIWTHFHDLIELQLRRDGELRPIAGFANKLGENAIRIAALISFFDDPNLKELSGEQMVNGIRVAQYYLAEAQRLLMTGNVDETIQDAQQLLDWLKSDKWEQDIVSAADIMQLGPKRFRTQKKLAPLLAILERHNWLSENGPATVRGSVRQQTYRIALK